MTRLERKQANYIRKQYPNLTDEQADDVIKYFFENYGGEGGCEECAEEEAVCYYCTQALENYMDENDY